MPGPAIAPIVAPVMADRRPRRQAASEGPFPRPVAPVRSAPVGDAGTERVVPRARFDVRSVVCVSSAPRRARTSSQACASVG
ncbi:hypothetical protein B4N89_44850 [Embleya scabrispora]|uniref:Uncharacterized protein n=1 Tax=Embleya scabrispora TaxID=159449 RepID=A0A1T3NIH4_9ACTN|nr:hypothetical protein B4N89_44850 [Embleya scabrispora]